MKIITQISILFFSFILLYSCNKNNDSLSSNKTIKEKKIKTYGIIFPERDSISVNLNLDEYKTYEELLKRLEQIDCKERIPKIILKNKNETKKIYFHLACVELKKGGTKERNVIEIYNDEIFKKGKKIPSIDSLANFLKKDITNYGKNYKLSESPNKLIILVSFDKKSSPKKLKNTLQKITNAFDKIGGKNILKINLSKFIPTPTPKTPPPPNFKQKKKKKTPPPPAPEKIEIIEKKEILMEVYDVDQEPYLLSCKNKIDKKACTKSELEKIIYGNFNSNILTKIDKKFSKELRIPVRYKVNSFGDISVIEIGVFKQAIIEKEIKRVFKLIPKMSPAIKDGKKVGIYNHFQIWLNTSK